MVPLVFVAALARNNVIGREGRLPWHIPTDLRHFRMLTLGRPMIVGRGTHQSIGRVLPGRTTILLSRSPPAERHPTLLHATTTEEAIALGQQVATAGGADSVVVVGGGRVFADLLPRADRLELTYVDLDVAGDTVFPALDPAVWHQRAQVRPPRAPDDEAAVTFVTLKRAEVAAVVMG